MSDTNIRELERRVLLGDREAADRLQAAQLRSGAVIVIGDDEAHRVVLPPGYDPARTMVVSATQFETWDLCKRKWWFLWPQDMPQPPNAAFKFGKVLHGVLERWYLADDLGRGPDLYPVGWDAGITPREANLIQRLVQLGIDSGLVVRHPNRKVEHSFLWIRAEVNGGSRDTANGWTIFVKGSIDLMDEGLGLIEDHKTTGNLRYAKSAAKLAENNQMLLYASELLRLQPHLMEVTLKHNVFVKDFDNPSIKNPPAVVKVSRQQIENRWTKLQATALEMLNARLAFDHESRHWQLPDPESRAHACRAYGGCPYQYICGGRESPAEYRIRMTDYLASHSQQQTLNTSVNGDPTMSNIFDQQLGAAHANGAIAMAPQQAPQINGPVPSAPAQGPNLSTVMFWWAPPGASQGVAASGADIQAQVNANPACMAQPCMRQQGDNGWSTVGNYFRPQQQPAQQQAPAPAGPPPPPPAPAPAPAPAQRPVPPWYRQGCTACPASPGWGSTGQPCRICDDLQRRDGGVTSDQFVITIDKGGVMWSPRPQQPAQAPAQPPAPQVQQQPQAAPQAPAQAPEGNGQGQPTEAAPAGGKKRRGRPTTTFTLIVGATVNEDAIDMSRMFETMAAELAKKHGAESYYDLDVYKRREAMQKLVPSIVGDLKGHWVVANCSNGSPDQANFRDTLRGFASTVIEGLRG